MVTRPHGIAPELFANCSESRSLSDLIKDHPGSTGLCFAWANRDQSGSGVDRGGASPGTAKC